VVWSGEPRTRPASRRLPFRARCRSWRAARRHGRVSPTVRPRTWRCWAGGATRRWPVTWARALDPAILRTPSRHRRVRNAVPGTVGRVGKPVPYTCDGSGACTTSLTREVARRLVGGRGVGVLEALRIGAAGTSSAHLSWAFQQRVRKRQRTAVGRRGHVTVRMIRSRCARASGVGTGTADSSAGCRGASGTRRSARRADSASCEVHHAHAVRDCRAMDRSWR